MPEYIHHPASYRDPSGFVFRVDGVYYRQVNQSYSENYDALFNSGLYKELTDKKLLLPHIETEETFTGDCNRYKTLRPEQLPVVSYSGEWSPSQLKDAAHLTLRILQIALDHNMILKDATPLNVQFRRGRPVFIDTLSFEKYDATQPWVAYRQFCECFLFPLYLHHYRPASTRELNGAYPEGIPASVTADLLPWRSRFSMGVWLHVFLPAKVHKDRLPGGRPLSFSKTKMSHLTANLTSILEGLNTSAVSPSTWNNYYRETIISSAYLAAKEKIFREGIADVVFRSALDLGANDGYFSKILAEKGTPVIAVDSDWQCINNLYQYTQQHPGADILPLCVDIANPTSASGFDNAERSSFTSRMPAEMVVALALLHHLVLGRNIPLSRIASYLSSLAQDWLIVEFIPLSDPKAIDLVRNRRTSPTAYDSDCLEQEFSRYFVIEKRWEIPGTERILYRMRKSS